MVRLRGDERWSDLSGDIRVPPERDGRRVAGVWFQIHPNLHGLSGPRSMVEELGAGNCLSRLAPDIEDGLQGWLQADWRLHMDDSRGIMGMNPVQARLTQAKTPWYRHRLASIEQRQMGVLMIRCSLGSTTLYPVNDGVLRRGYAAPGARAAPEYLMGEETNGSKNHGGAK